MAVALKVLPSIGTQPPEIISLLEVGFTNFPATRFCRDLGFHIDIHQKKKKIKVGLVKAVRKVDETSSLKVINGQPDLDFPYGFSNGNGNGNGTAQRQMSTLEKSTNIVWHECSVNKHDRQQLLQQKGCVIWITGLSGSGKSTLACALSHSLHTRGKLTYVLDGDNVRHGLNKNLSFGAEDRAENIRRVGEVAKLFADAGVICIASLISPYRKDRDACRALLPKGDFIEVFMDVPLQLCESRDPKGLYKLARAGKIKGFTGIDDPYERPLNCEIVLQQKSDTCTSPCEMAETVVSYLEDHGYLQA
ncbi:adenylyl-sulfate kinase 3-like isoform X2 [Amaranthus tricolor]|uniref:adenylyl-sulfate kinase 3-like isoform X2 n=1 Tax=Amaranthus tricolor TaxID=29722 RepID=UPI0025828A14|nr:adenylyl-sulfate kinase 3-like isoform X2 [Amaranthus tricolor]